MLEKKPGFARLFFTGFLRTSGAGSITQRRDRMSLLN
jgi:hypothetical protein